MKKVSDTYLNENVGIFKLLQNNNFTFLPSSDNDLPVKLDLIYYYRNSGDKKLAPFYNKLYKKYELEYPAYTESQLNALVMGKIADSVGTIYGDKWEKLYTSMVVASYDALNNYDITEVEEPDLTTENTTLDNTFGFDSTGDDGEHKDKRSYVSETTGTNTTERTGRDGKITAQKMLEQEIAVRKNLFYEILFSDIDSIFALKIYI